MIIGMSKCGIPGLGILNVAIFQNIFAGQGCYGIRTSSARGWGSLCSDCLSTPCRLAKDSKTHSLGWSWRSSRFFVLGNIDNAQARLLIGASLLVMIALHLLNRNTGNIQRSGLLAPRVGPIIGGMAGFVSMIANAAGPLMTLYLLAMRMPKMAFLGTSVYFFTLLNLFKIPFLVYLNIITIESAGKCPIGSVCCRRGFFGILFRKEGESGVV